MIQNPAVWISGRSLVQPDLDACLDYSKNSKEAKEEDNIRR